MFAEGTVSRREEGRKEGRAKELSEKWRKGGKVTEPNERKKEGRKEGRGSKKRRM